MKFDQKQFHKANNTVQILIILGIFIVINVLVSFLPVRWDLTEGKDFSISPTTKRIVKELDDVVTIKAYFTNDLPGRLIPLRQQVNDILDEYANYGKGNIQISFIDPADDTALEQEVRGLGIPPVQFSTVEEDKYEVANGYLGMAISYANNSEVIPVVQNTATLEYELTNAIKKVTSDEELVVAFATGHGELTRTENFTEVNKYLAKQYRVQDFDLSMGQLVPETIKTLIIAQPEEIFNERELYVIDQFLMSGGSILALIDGVEINEQMQTTKVSTGLENLLTSHGIAVNQDLVLDVSSDMASFSSGYVQFFTQYPFFVKALAQFMNQESPLVNRLEAITLPWVSSVQIVDQPGDDRILTNLVMTTEQAWSQTNSYNLDPQQKFAIPDSERKQFVLAAAKFGRFDSVYLGQDVPMMEDETQSEAMLGSTDNGRLTVVGDSEFATDGFLGRNLENLTFFSNLVDGLTQDMDLIMIRSKSITDRPIKELSYGWKQAIRYLNIFIPTLILIIYGFIRLYIRKKETREDVI
ncbi:MAG: hypothetical protein AUJ28_00735 [Parcubacteria group bacterium CG1_02_37_51]|uniref:Uncharacterized protein n=3 Tax=Candidatus Komeiliibacteriota TaxID=1817908 RepID=A0A2M7RCI5_9BACT|nr:MAG: hypothetical protein AUJ28_00735 [Parcubacteria group bacterium CG1_02_37_51]PIY94384.1 MAG: hypothetical protein COY67_02555 [Candidatus Komeilibacteria bacterium CG_4_10_14_0_8_um_filter_37_78]